MAVILKVVGAFLFIYLFIFIYPFLFFSVVIEALCLVHSIAAGKNMLCA